MNSAWPVIETEWDHAVAGFLRAHPGWLADHPELYRALTPPSRVHGEPMADHMAAMLRQERLHAEAMTEQRHAILAAGRAAATMVGRVQEAVLALMTTLDPVDCVLSELPRLLDVDAVCLCGKPARPGMNTAEGPRLMDILGQRDVAWRNRPDDAARLYAEAAPLARHDVLIRLPGLGVLALGSRATLAGELPQTMAALRFLGRAVAASLSR